MLKNKRHIKYKIPKTYLKFIMLIKLFIILSAFNEILSNNNINLIKSYIYSITLTIKGTGTLNFLSSSFSSTYYPNQIKVGGTNIDLNSISYSFSSSLSTVQLIWNNIVKDCYRMFYACTAIYNIDLTDFDTSQVTYMNSMFRDCTSLTSINFANFDASQLTCVEYMFSGCTSLIYINFGTFNENHISSGHYTNMFSGVPDHIVFCISQSATNTLAQLNSRKCKINYCINDWQRVQRQLINGECRCFQNGPYKYDYYGSCLNTCPNGDYQDEITSIFYCKCELSKCHSCPLAAFNQNLCDKCNTDYYPMENDPTNKGTYFNCYDKIKGYYLAQSNSIFKKCYESCAECSMKGDSNNHNCNTCNSSYPISFKKGSYYNCYSSCNGLYFFDNNNNYHCLQITECPKGYNKIIRQKNQCTRFSCNSTILIKIYFIE